MGHFTCKAVTVSRQGLSGWGEGMVGGTDGSGGYGSS